MNKNPNLKCDILGHEPIFKTSSSSLSTCANCGERIQRIHRGKWVTIPYQHKERV